MQFESVIAAHIAGRTVVPSLLAHMDFVDAPRRWWTGFGDLVIGEETWQGIGDLIAIDGLEASVGTAAASPITFTLSGIDATIVTLAANATTRVKGRRCVVYVQFFDRDTWAPLDDPIVLRTGVMDKMRFQASGPGNRTVILTAEGLWTGRNQSPAALYTDRDQQLRFAGDRFFERVAELASKTIRWPQ